MNEKQVELASNNLSKIKKRTFGLQVIVGIVAIACVIITLYLILQGKDLGPKVGAGGVLITILTACIIATLRLHTCLNSIDVTVRYIHIECEDKAVKTLDNSTCLKGSGLQEILQKGKANG